MSRSRFNYPVLTSAVGLGQDKMRFFGLLEGKPNRRAFRVEFFLATREETNPGCDASGYGEGLTYLGFKNVTVGITGQATFVATLKVGQGAYVSGTSMVTATATGPDGSTS